MSLSPRRSKRVTVAPYRLLATEKLTTFGRSRVSCANSRGPVYLALQDDAACNLMSSGVWCGVS